MNTTITTILGTAALGLIKSKMGSGLQKFSKACYVYYEETYEIHRSDEEKVIQLIRDLEPLINKKGYLLHSIKSYPGSFRNGDPNSEVFVEIRKVLTSPQDIEECNDWNVHLSDFEDFIDTPPGAQLFNFVCRNISDKIEDKFWLNDIGNELSYGYGKLVVNAKTGEVYKPPLRKSKLRKR